MIDDRLVVTDVRVCYLCTTVCHLSSSISSSLFINRLEAHDYSDTK